MQGEKISPIRHFAKVRSLFSCICLVTLFLIAQRHFLHFSLKRISRHFLEGNPDLKKAEKSNHVSLFQDAKLSKTKKISSLRRLFTGSDMVESFTKAQKQRISFSPRCFS